MKTTLSPREKQILKMLLAEYSQQEICKSLNLHSNTVSSYKCNIMEKWEVETMIGLFKEAVKRGYLELEDDTFENESTTTPKSSPKEVIYEYKESSKNKITIYLK